MPVFVGCHLCENMTRVLTTKDTARTPPDRRAAHCAACLKAERTDGVVAGGEDGWDKRLKKLTMTKGTGDKNRR